MPIDNKKGKWELRELWYNLPSVLQVRLYRSDQGKAISFVESVILSTTGEIEELYLSFTENQDWYFLKWMGKLDNPIQEAKRQLRQGISSL